MLPTGQINAKVRDVVQIFDDDYSTQWWEVLKANGERGIVPMTSLEVRARVLGLATWCARPPAWRLIYTYV